MKFHTFGDSHAYFAWDQIDGVSTHGIGPVTAQSFGRLKFGVLNIADPKFNIAEGDTACFSFGEIDCRCHVGKFKNSYQSLIDNIVKHYIEAVKTNVQQFQNVRSVVYNIPPTLRKADATENVDYPFVGEDEDRAMYIRYMNSKIKDLCNSNGILFFDVYEAYTGEDGFLKKELSDNLIHIYNPVHIREFLNNNNLLG